MSLASGIFNNPVNYFGYAGFSCKKCGGKFEYPYMYLSGAAACPSCGSGNIQIDGWLQKMVESDPVNHPSHYQHPSGVECITIVRHHNFSIGNAIKYLWRAGLKDGSPATQDLRKAIFYIQDEIERLEKSK